MAMERRSLPTLSTLAKAAGREGRCMSCSGKSFLYHIGYGLDISVSVRASWVKPLCWQESILWKCPGQRPLITITLKVAQRR